MTDVPKPQSEKFRELAKQAEVDEDEAKLDQILKRMKSQQNDKKPAD